jgi:hypothetical protein
MNEGLNKTVLIIIASVFILILYAGSTLASQDCSTCGGECVGAQRLSSCTGGCGTPCQDCEDCYIQTHCNGDCFIGRCGAECKDDSDCSGSKTCNTETCACETHACDTSDECITDDDCTSAAKPDCSPSSCTCVPEFPTALIGITAVTIAVLSSVFIPRVTSNKKNKK